VRLRDQLLTEAKGDATLAAARLAWRLEQGDPANFKAGYSRANAILAARETFPQVFADDLADRLAEIDAFAAWTPREEPYRLLTGEDMD
jgi:hypothetical protein